MRALSSTPHMRAGATLRVFAIASGRKSLSEEQQGLSQLLSKLRIPTSDVIVLNDKSKEPRADRQ